MPAPDLTADNYTQALQALLPRGRAWPRDPAAIQSRVLAGLAGLYARQTQRANYLLADGFPKTSTELLPEWEKSLGLPDPCVGSAPSTVVRRNQVVARFINGGGQSAAFFVAFAASLGYAIRIEMLTPACCGQQRCGDPINGDEGWAHVWRVFTEETQLTYASCGLSVCGDPLRSWNDLVLKCELDALAPAHTVVFYALDPAGDLLLDDAGGRLLLDDGSFFSLGYI